MRMIFGDCLDVLPTLDAGSVDAVVTDPPASISFMDKEWDGDRGGRAEWTAWLADVLGWCLRSLKEGGYALVWSIPRRSHWTAIALEDAGFEIRDRISHLFGSGFPKGKGCLKPACEDWWLARRPGPRVLPLNIDGCRVACEPRPLVVGPPKNGADAGRFRTQSGFQVGTTNEGRYPANVVHDGSDEVLEAFAAFGERAGNSNKNLYATDGKIKDVYQDGWDRTMGGMGRADTGTAARFFYCAKASRKERGEGNGHPTVKPLALMRWLVRLVTQPGDTVLDPFLGSGTTALACAAEGRECVGVERDAAYFAIAEKRLAEAQADAPLFAGTD